MKQLAKIWIIKLCSKLRSERKLFRQVKVFEEINQNWYLYYSGYKIINIKYCYLQTHLKKTVWRMNLKKVFVPIVGGSHDEFILMGNNNTVGKLWITGKSKFNLVSMLLNTSALIQANWEN